MTNHSSLGPAPFLVEHMEILPKGRALDVAMGAGGVLVSGIYFIRKRNYALNKN